MGVDWSSEGVDWRDESLYDEMAHDWLRATHGPNLFATDVWDRVLELTQSDLDPPRAWRLTKRLVELAEGDTELWYVGREALAEMVRNHEKLVAGELEYLYRTDPKWRQAFVGQLFLPPANVKQLMQGGDSGGTPEKPQ
jgi:hypothetical protein